MNNNKVVNPAIKSLIELLANEDGLVRENAREELVELGKPATSFLIQALQSSKLDQVRWEAAKALGEINDVTAIPALVEALEDANSDVAWLAAVALQKHEIAAWPSLLRALVKNETVSPELREGAHHVLVNQTEQGYNDLLASLSATLKVDAIPGALSAAVSEMQERMKANS